MGFYDWEKEDLEQTEFEIWRRRQVIAPEAKYEDAERRRRDAFRAYGDAHRRLLEKPDSKRRLAKFTKMEKKFLAVSEETRIALQEFITAREAASLEAFERFQTERQAAKHV